MICNCCNNERDALFFEADEFTMCLICGETCVDYNECQTDSDDILDELFQ